jgi:glycosyltransferase involved in cell wall biosynthesis
MRCLHLTLTTARGGRRDAILTLISNLRGLGVTCGLAGLRDTRDEVAPLESRLDFHDGVASGQRPDAKTVGHLWRICRQHRVEVLHAHDAGSQSVASALRLLLPRLRIVMTFHRTLGVDSEGWRNRLRNRVTLPAVARVITASEERKRYFARSTGLSAVRITVIPHGVDLATFHPDPTRRQWAREVLRTPPESLLLVAAGHFGPEKGLDQTMRGVSAALERHPELPAHLVVLGSGRPDQETAMHQLGESLLGNRVTFLGFRSDAAAWLQAADLLVHAPRMEAFGLVTTQAMACGIPVVATAVGGLPEIVTDGETGRLVQSAEPDALGAAIAGLLGDRGAREAAGRAALVRAVDHFDARHCAERHLALYREVTG